MNKVSKTYCDLFQLENSDEIVGIGINDPIPQLDGNISTTQLNNSNTSSDMKPTEQLYNDLTPLPRLYITNARSVFPKFKNFVEHLIHYRIGVGSISETWEDHTSIKHKLKIEKLENVHGFKWFGCSRPKKLENGTVTSGGGQAIVINTAIFNANRINEIIVPKQLETTNNIVWVKVIPKIKCSVSVIIVCGIYFKPKSKAKSLLNDHLVSNYHFLKSKYKNIRFIFCGDFNDFNSDILVNQSAQLR